ncbi:hypothetical protein JTB14_003863 [Gonioctena quinquepunctata]|nr:hypothetical protein JTB14_003863 [Gonioctena quinquepunctata]
MESLTNRNKSKEQQIKQIKSNSSQIIEEPSEMAEAFLEHHTSIGKKLAEDCKHDPTFSAPQTHMENSIYISETDEVEVEEIIKTLKSMKSLGPDGLRSETLKAICSYISQPLAF